MPILFNKLLSFIQKCKDPIEESLTTRPIFFTNIETKINVSKTTNLDSEEKQQFDILQE